MNEVKGLTGLKERRSEKGVSQTVVGRNLGVKRNTVCQWENGTRNPSVEALKKLAAYFNCSVDDLL